MTQDDFVREPDETMLLLAHIKNNECLSWRQLADEYMPDYSHAYVRKVTLGEARSDAISIALGIKPEPPETRLVEVCPDCGEVHEVKVTCSHKLERQRRKTPYRTLAFRFFDDDAFERARAVVDAGGDRTRWLMEITEVADE